MDGGVNTHSHNERAAEKLMDEYLKSLGLHRKKIAKDGSCLFRAVAEQVLHCQSLHTEVRSQCVEFLKKNREVYEAFIEGDFEDYLRKLQDPQQWVGEVEINALAAMYKRDFLIYQEPGKPAVPITGNHFKEKVQLCFLNGNHYDSVYPVSHIKNSAICQSILYELLYDDVFHVDRSALSGLCQRTGRPNDFLSDDGLPACVSSDESELDSGDAFRGENGTTSSRQSYRGRGRVSHRLRRSLNPTLYRNVQYDVWQKSKRAQQKMDYCIAAGMQYTVGGRCQVRLESGGRSYSAVIQEVPPNNGLVTVYIEELGRKQVPLWSIRSSSDENSWSTVINRDKKLINGHGEWEERAKGRGRGKFISASSSVAPGCGGRMQKQHSAEEPAGTKPIRKSANSSESMMFGLSEEQRLAREEEERNMALVEIQLRDEQSFPALGAQSLTQGDGGKRKGGEKRRSQRTRAKSPAEDVKALSPSAGERPKSSTQTLAPSTAATPSTTNATKPAAAAAASPPNSEPGPPQMMSLKASAPDTVLTGAAPGSTPRPPPTSAAPTAKTNAHASAAGAQPGSPPPVAAPSTKRPLMGGAPPQSVPSSASIFSVVTPVLPAASSTSSSSFPPLKASATPPPSSSVPPPTFIAPIAPSPAAAQGFLSTSPFPRSSPSFSALPSSPSPPSFSPQTVQKSSSFVIHHAAQVQEAPTAPAQTPNSAPQTCQSSLSQIHPQVYQPQNQGQISVSLNQAQASLPQAEISPQPSFPQTQTQSSNSVPQNQVLMPQMQMVPQNQHQLQSQTEVTSLPQPQMQPAVSQTPGHLQQTQASLSHIQLQSQAQYSSQTRSEFTQVLSRRPPPGTPYPNVPQAAVEVSGPMQPQLPVAHPHNQLVQPPHPSQVPHPSLSLAASLTHPTLQSQSPNTHDKSEALSPPVPQPQPEPPVHSVPQQPHPLHPLLYPSPHPQSIPGAVPLQTLSQLYQDPLYPGFPQAENCSVAPTPPFSSSKSGDDLPKDVNILRFFFNLGIKAYTLPVFAPCVYLMPLQQAYTMHPKPPSRSPSPTPLFPSSNPPGTHQETYPQYPSNSASVTTQYDLQAPGPEPAHPSQAAYPVTQAPPHRMSWQQHQMPPPRSSVYPGAYPSTTPPYPVTLPQPPGYPSGEDPGHPAFAPAMSQYPPPSLGYHQSSTPDEFQGSKAIVAHHQPANGDTMPGHGLSRGPGPLEGPAAANVANANNNRTIAAHGATGFAFKKEQEESVLLVDPPLNNRPIHINVMTMKTSSAAGAHDISKPKVPMDHNPSRMYRGPRKPYGAAMEPSQAPCLQHVAVSDSLSVACSTEDEWEDEVFHSSTITHRGPRRVYRGSRGRGGHDGGRGGQRRRQEVGVGFNHSQYGHSYQGQSWGRGY